jgi:hypothetical protein
VEEEDAADEEEPPATRVVAMRMDRFIVDRFDLMVYSKVITLTQIIFYFSILLLPAMGLSSITSSEQFWFGIQSDSAIQSKGNELLSQPS